MPGGSSFPMFRVREPYSVKNLILSCWTSSSRPLISLGGYGLVINVISWPAILNHYTTKLEKHINDSTCLRIMLSLYNLQRWSTSVIECCCTYWVQAPCPLAWADFCTQSLTKRTNVPSHWRFYLPLPSQSNRKVAKIKEWARYPHWKAWWVQECQVVSQMMPWKEMLPYSSRRKSPQPGTGDMWQQKGLRQGM